MEENLYEEFERGEVLYDLGEQIEVDGAEEIALKYYDCVADTESEYDTIKGISKIDDWYIFKIGNNSNPFIGKIEKYSIGELENLLEVNIRRKYREDVVERSKEEYKSRRDKKLEEVKNKEEIKEKHLLVTNFENGEVNKIKLFRDSDLAVDKYLLDEYSDMTSSVFEEDILHLTKEEHYHKEIQVSTENEEYQNRKEYEEKWNNIDPDDPKYSPIFDEYGNGKVVYDVNNGIETKEGIKMKDKYFDCICKPDNHFERIEGISKVDDKYIFMVGNGIAMTTNRMEKYAIEDLEKLRKNREKTQKEKDVERRINKGYDNIANKLAETISKSGKELAGYKNSIKQTSDAQDKKSFKGLRVIEFKDGEMERIEFFRDNDLDNDIEKLSTYKEMTSHRFNQRIVYVNDKGFFKETEEAKEINAEINADKSYSKEMEEEGKTKTQKRKGKER